MTYTSNFSNMLFDGPVSATKYRNNMVANYVKQDTSSVDDFVKNLVEYYKANPLSDDDEARKKEFEKIKAAMSGSYAKAFLNIPNGDG
mgnify:CR=1 FL=1